MRLGFTRKIGLSAAFLAVFQLCSQGQQTMNFGNLLEPRNRLFRKACWELAVFPRLNAAAKMTHLSTAAYKLSASPQLSYEVGIHRITNLQPNLGLSVGLRIGFITRNAEFTLPPEEVDNSYEASFNGVISREQDVSYFSLPVDLEYRSFINSKTMLFGGGGFSLRYAPMNNSYTELPNTLRVYLTAKNTPFVNANILVGFGKLLRNHDVLRFGIDVNYDPDCTGCGRFEFATKHSFDSGKYLVRANSIGLSIAYLRTGVSKIIQIHLPTE